jgi:hypothetical protein
MNIKGKSVRAGVVENYKAALEDLRLNPGKYTATQWSAAHSIGNSVPRALVKLGYAKRVSRRMYLQRERITDLMIQQLVEQKREFDNLHKVPAPLQQKLPLADAAPANAKRSEMVRYTYEKKFPFRVDAKDVQALNDLVTAKPAEVPTLPAPVPALTQPTRVGLIRRFLRWIW